MKNINDFSMDFFSLKGKNAIVTGGVSGLGQAFALALAKAGANIFVFAAVRMMTEQRRSLSRHVVLNMHLCSAILQRMVFVIRLLINV